MLNPLKSQGHVPVAIFHLGDEWQFLPISEDYQDTLQEIILGFDLDHDVRLSLRTSTMGVCRGREIVINERAYHHLWTFLDVIDVTVGQAATRGKHREKTPTRSKHDDSETLDFLASSTVILPEPLIDQERSRTPIPESEGIGRAAGKSYKYVEDEYNEDEIMIPPKTAENPTKHIEVERSEDEIMPQVSQKVEPPKAVEAQATEPEDNGEGGSNLHIHKKFRPAGMVFSKSNKVTGSPVTVKKEKLAEPVNEGIGTPPKNLEPVKLNPPASQPEEDPRFEITINGPQNESAQFKTRGKHPVRKVLAAACKTFGIKYERARLILRVSIEEDGSIYTNEFDCPAEETMSQCGVDGNAKLFVMVEEDQDDEEE